MLKVKCFKKKTLRFNNVTRFESELLLFELSIKMDEANYRDRCDTQKKTTTSPSPDQIPENLFFLQFNTKFSMYCLFLLSIS